MLTALTDRMQALEASQMRRGRATARRNRQWLILRQRWDAAWAIRLYIVTR
uniref:Transposase n=1 Tax=Peronospora matthiolae TaxID=2874970 RepID=A0AAV1UIG2_9STRA